MPRQDQTEERREEGGWRREDRGERREEEGERKRRNDDFAAWRGGGRICQLMDITRHSLDGHHKTQAGGVYSAWVLEWSNRIVQVRSCLYIEHMVCEGCLTP